MVEVFRKDDQKKDGVSSFETPAVGTFHDEKLCALYNSNEYRPNENPIKFPHWHCFVKNKK